MSTLRERVRTLVDDHRFQQFIIAVIVLNAITLGLQTSPAVNERVGGLLAVIDVVALVIYVIELVLRIYAYQLAFFQDPWNVFDFVIVAIALIPASEAFTVLRALRILRVLRLVSMVPSMRRVVAGLLAAVPGMASIAALLALIIYVFAVIGTTLYGAAAPRYFGSLGTTLFTMFQTMTGEAWPDIAREVMAYEPSAWIYFVVYILVTTFAVLNLFIAVVVSAMEGQVMDEARAEEAEHAAEKQVANRQILEEVRALRAELAEVRAADR
jgi:voltage-gated sodium channel